MVVAWFLFFDFWGFCFDFLVGFLRRFFCESFFSVIGLLFFFFCFFEGWPLALKVGSNLFIFGISFWFLFLCCCILVENSNIDCLFVFSDLEESPFLLFFLCLFFRFCLLSFFPSFSAFVFLFKVNEVRFFPFIPNCSLPKGNPLRFLTLAFSSFVPSFLKK